MKTYPSSGQQEVGCGIHGAWSQRDFSLPQGHTDNSSHVGLWTKYVDGDSQGVSCDKNKQKIYTSSKLNITILYNTRVMTTDQVPSYSEYLLVK